MRCFFLFFGFFLGDGLAVQGDSQTPIDRHALVSRHNIDWPVLDGQIPLGNGNFAFNADGTGLETVGGNTMSHWCWHSFPLPPGVTQNDIQSWATPDRGRLKTTGTTRPPQVIYDWERQNPFPLNLGRIGFIDQQGVRLNSGMVRIDSRHLDLWSGLLSSHFTYLGKKVEVETCVDSKSDTVAVHVESPLLKDGSLKIMVDFPGPINRGGPWLGDFLHQEGHQTVVINQADNRLNLQRIIDDIHYQVTITGTGFTISPASAAPVPKIIRARYGADGGGWADVKAKIVDLLQGRNVVTANNSLTDDPAPGRIKRLEITYRLNGTEQTKNFSENESWNMITGTSPHQFVLVAAWGKNTLDLTCRFAPEAATETIPSVAEIKTECAQSWAAFWGSGGAIDLSGSTDPRWKELERRIVLSQYEEAVQCAGDNPPAEVGLTGTDPWQAKWHFEMIWWHLAHYALWDRWAMADKALTIYSRITPVARSIARNFDYQGLMWPKSTGPDGYNDGYSPEMALLWKEPHPIFFAELDYRLYPTPETLAKWKDVVFGTADFMADYPTRDSTGQYNLDPVWPASEGRQNPLRRNTIFELGYWHAALEMAQQWRLRLGLEREPHWDEVAGHLAPLPEKDGLYIFSDGQPDTFTVRSFDHVDNIGIAGMLPPFLGLDKETARRTVKEVAHRWAWDACWGWDFPWMAMASARVGEPKLAVEALFNPSPKNNYDKRGICTGGPGPYLPGNGGLLYAVAMMAAGWDGAPTRPAPGFPDDGTWNVRWEDLKPAP